MLKRKFLYDLHRGCEGDLSLSHHAKLSANVISRLTRELDKHPLPYAIDYKYPYHLIVHCNGRISVHAGGWDNRMDVLRLRLSGEPCDVNGERGFMTPKGVVNYILRNWGRRMSDDR